MQTGSERKAITDEFLHNTYPPESWIRIFTDGSAENAVKMEEVKYLSNFLKEQKKTSLLQQDFFQQIIRQKQSLWKGQQNTST